MPTKIKKHIHTIEPSVIGDVLVNDVWRIRAAEAEEAFKQLGDQNREILESITDAFFSLDHDWRFTYVNRHTELLLDRKSNELLGKSIWEMYPGLIGSDFEKRYRMAMDDGVPSTITSYYQDHQRWYEVRLYPTSKGITVYFRDRSEEKTAEQSLKQSEARFRAAVAAVSSLVWTNDAEGKMAGEQPGWGNFTGQTLEEYEGYGWSNAVHPDDSQPTIDAWNVAVTEKRPFVFEHRVRRHDGEWRLCSIKAVPLFNDDGSISEWVGVHNDITERKQAENKIRESEQKLRAIYDGTNEYIGLLSPKGTLLDTNLASLEFGPSKREDEVGRPFWDTVWFRSTPGASDIVRESIKTAATGITVRFDALIITPAGEKKFFDLSFCPILDESGNVVLIVPEGREITMQKSAEVILRQQAELIELSHEPIFVWELNGGIVEWNRGAEKLYGFSREEAMGRTSHVLLRSINQVSIETVKAQLMADGLWSGEIRHHTKDHREVLIESCQQLLDSDGRKLVLETNRDITERKNAEIALRKSEERLQLAQQAGNVGIWDWDIVADRIYWSETMWSIYGETQGSNNPDDALWIEHLHSNDRERVKLNLREVVASAAESEFRDEYRIVRKDGSIRWIEAVAEVSRNESGLASRMYGVNIDITPRKEAEERLKLSEHQLRLVTNAVPALISYVDTNERYRFANQKFKEWFGIPNEEIIGKRVRDVFGMKGYRVVKPRINEALLGNKCTFETALNYKVAGTKYVHVSYIPDIGVDGTVYGYYGLTHDLTDLKMSHDLLRSSESKIGLMMESMLDYAIFSIDCGGLIDSWNKGAEIIFGYSTEEIIGQPCEILYTHEDAERDLYLREMRTARKKGRASYDRWHLRKDGTRFFASGIMMPVYVGQELTGYAKIARDLTEKQRQAEDLQRAHNELELRVIERTKELAESNLALVQEMEERKVAERQKTNLLQRLVTSQEFERRRIARDLHDQLGQRLTALRLKIASLKDFSRDNEELSSRVEHIQEIGERLDAEASFLAWELRPTALDNLGLVDAVGAFVNEWSRHYEIVADFHSSGLTKDRLDHEIETHLYRITQEALNNIVKHADAKNVLVLLDRRDENLILVIEDDGTGFDPGIESQPGESSKGLGLVGMHERATLIGGEVEIESAPGNGTAIYVRVPVSL